jgi:tetratricopeptide (TPR) repeat protein
MHSRLLSWSRGLYLAGMVLALVLVIPTAWFPFQLAKVAAFATLLALAAVCWAFSGAAREVLRSRGFSAALLAGLLPLAYAVSWAFSTDKSVALSGFSLEADTLAFAALACAAFMLAFALFRTLRTVRMLLAAVFWALVAAVIFQYVSILFGSSAIPFATFADRSVNLIGKWNDLGLLAGLLMTMLLVQFELAALTVPRRIAAGVALVALAVMLAFVNFSVVWGMMLAVALIVALVKFIVHRGMGEESPFSLYRVPWASLATALLAVALLFFGTAVNSVLTSAFPVSSLEVRPSYSSTMDVINAARGASAERLIVGTGPSTFGEEWLLHKPAAVNQSAFWNLDFNVGFSTALTALGSVGLLGALGWLMPLFLVLASFVRVWRLRVLNRGDFVVAVLLVLGSLYLITSLLLYVPSQNALILAFVLSGATFGFLWRQGQSGAEEPVESSRLFGYAAAGAAIVMVVLCGWVGVTADRRLVAEAYVGRGTLALQNGDADAALADANAALRVKRIGDALRLSVDAGSAKLEQLGTTQNPTQLQQQQFAALASSTVALGVEAVRLNPADYRPVFSLAQLYDYLSSIGVQGAAQTALNAYQAAAALDPTNPVIPLNEARLAVQNNNTQLTTQFLQKALTLKPNYTDAILLVVQLDVANKDIPSAIRAATAAAQTAPGVAPIWFELGLLYYTNNDFKDAAAALEQALAIEPNYANAQYFLGLSQYALGDAADATKQFEALSANNPDNSEVKLILANMQAGKPPFTGETPPAPAPQKRASAPVSE